MRDISVLICCVLFCTTFISELHSENELQSVSKSSIHGQNV